MLDDKKIIALFWARREDAIAAIAERYGARCEQIARNILQNARDAEECVNDAYLAIWNTIPPEKPDPLQSYLFRIVRNIATTRYHSNTAEKRNSRYDAALDEWAGLLSSSENVEKAVEVRELTTQIERFLDTLDRPNRVLFVRRYWYADDIPTLAADFSMNSHTVTVRLSRIRKKLKQYLQKEGDIP